MFDLLRLTGARPAGSAARLTRGRRLLSLTVGLAFVGFLGCAHTQNLAKPPRRFSLRTPGSILRLENGLQVLISPDTRGQLIRADLRLRVGARDDPAGSEGLAHFVEHMMFQREAGDGSGRTVKQALARFSLADNASTNVDETHYYATTTRAHLPELLAIMARFLEPRCEEWSDATIANELDVVRNELRQRGSDAYTGFLRLTQAVYPDAHPYARSVGGDQESLSTIDRATLCAFAERYYTAANANLVLTGRLTEADSRTQLRQYFVPLARKQRVQRENIAVPDIAGQHREVAIPSPRPITALAFALPRRFEDAHFVATLVEDALGWRLGRHADRRSGVLNSGVWRVGGRHAPVLVLWAATREDADLKAIRRQLRAILDGAMRQISRPGRANQFMRQRARLEVLEAMSSPSSRPRMLADYMDVHLIYPFHAGDVARIDALEARKVLEHIDDIFGEDRQMTLDLVPEQAEQTLAAISQRPAKLEHPRGRRSAGSGEIDLSALLKRVEFSEADPSDWIDTRLENGLRVVIARSSELPIFNMQVIVATGHDDAPAAFPRMALELARGLNFDYRSWDTQEVGANFSLSGGVWSTWVDRKTTQFFHSGLSSYIDHAIAGMAHLVVQGRVSHDKIEDTSHFQRSMVSSAARTTGIQEKQRLWEALFGAEHPYARPLHAQPGQLSQIKPQDFAKFKTEHYRADRTTVIITGGFDPRLALAHVEARFAERSIATGMMKWNHASVDAPSPFDDIEFNNVDKRLLTVEDNDLDQLEFQLVVQSRTSDLRGIVERRLIQGMIRLSLEGLRSNEGATYGVGTRDDHDRPAWHLHGALDPSFAQAGMRQLVEHLTLYANGTQTPELEAHFETTRLRLLRALLTESSGHIELANRISRMIQLGLEPNQRAEVAEILLDMDFPSVMAAAKRVLGPGRRVLQLTGPRPLLRAGQQGLKEAI